ncbi:MAG: hypothetical protein HYT19_00120 [Candidatus Nealsonbacteria bacterium]|nr:hypothetical protein [Candidatus Nealsonbacteria bacterium]
MFGQSKKDIIFILTLGLVLVFGAFQLVQGVTKSINQTASITVNCSDPDGNLSQCNVTSPCTQNCPASGSSGSCSCQFTCTVVETYSACGEAIDAKGLADTKCLDTVVCANAGNQPPDASISCDASLCPGGSCNGSWIAFQPLADPSPCIYKIKNNSTDPDNNIASSKWYLNGIEKSTCPGVCDYTLQSDVAPGSYTVKLRVEDVKGLFDEAVHSLSMKGEVRAGFMCSLDNINWQACGALSNKISQGGLLYLKDDPSLAEYSAASQGAAITSRQWKINGLVFDGSSANPSVNLTLTSNIIRLTVIDSAGRSDYAEHTVGASLPLPEWREISPF